METHLRAVIVISVILCACEGPPAWGSKCVQGLNARGVGYDMGISPDGSRLLVTYRENYGTAATQVALYDVQRGSVIKSASNVITADSWPPRQLRVPEQMQWRDSMQLFSLKYLDGIYKWAPEANVLSKVFDCRDCRFFSVSANDILAVSIFENESNRLEIWDLTTMKQLQMLPSPPGQHVATLRWSPNGKKLAMILSESDSASSYVYSWTIGDVTAKLVGSGWNVVQRAGPTWLDDHWVMVNDSTGISWSRVNVDSGEWRPLVSLQPPDSNSQAIFEFAADRQPSYIAFTVERGLYVLDVRCATGMLPGAEQPQSGVNGQ